MKTPRTASSSAKSPNNLNGSYKYLYAANTGSNSISVFRTTNSGLELVEVEPSGGDHPISVTKHNNLRYVLNGGTTNCRGGTPTITGFTVGAKGDLTPIPDSTRPVSGGSMAGCAQISFTQRGQLLTTVNSGAAPPLRDRPGDIALLVESALRRIQTGRPRNVLLSCSPFAMRMLRTYPWPGNVRELLTALESAAIRADGDRIEAQHLPLEIRTASEPDGVEADVRYQAKIGGEDERGAILAALEEAEGSRTHAAEILGMGRTTLWRKLKSYGIEPDSDVEP